ncbi:RNA polymerase sigma factor [Bacillus sp. REN16]|uniref:RNA polymerase sigma factor n=1 Tax=Bacillus sp. REN16 TaxID=2887296 RepID=UPI001E5B6389|nr:RNA polymerase sigma factor [Bacillus sp. REN16]MCC3358465.1 RNA polymerase sigma factor [Bacillus sp. REN16]
MSFDIEKIYDLYHRDVYHFALFYTNNRQEAEDITQETFIKIMKNIASLQNPERMKTWIFSIAKHTAIDLKRKQSFMQFLPDWIYEKASEEATPENKVIQKKDWEELQEALIKLKPTFRSVLILRGLKELSIKETAEIMGCSERKIRVDYHRAIQQMKRLVQVDEEGWGLNEQSK